MSFSSQLGAGAATSCSSARRHNAHAASCRTYATWTNNVHPATSTSMHFCRPIARASRSRTLATLATTSQGCLDVDAAPAPQLARSLHATLSTAGNAPASDNHPQSSRLHRRRALTTLPLALAALLAGASGADAGGVKCPGMSGYALSKCLKEQRLKREASGEDTEEERGHKYEQPGELFTLPSGARTALLSLSQQLDRTFSVPGSCLFGLRSLGSWQR